MRPKIQIHQSPPVYDLAIRKPGNRHLTAITTGGLARLRRAPDEVRWAAPLLPALDIALRPPQADRSRVIRVPPRTNRLSVWWLNAE